MVTQLPGGLLATLFGGKWVFGIGILITSLLTILTPFAARFNVNLFIALRIAEGIGEVGPQHYLMYIFSCYACLSF